MNRLPRSLRTAVAGVLLAALGTATGAHWVALQSVAWVQMLAAYSRDASFAEAARKTFDGDHPCPLCNEISREKRAPKQEDSTLSTENLTLLCDQRPALLPPVRASWTLRSDEPRVHALICRPPTPPPRAALAA